MRAKFYGVRGSVPAPGPSTARYGGNTSCVCVELSDESLLILDAGTGLRELGNALLSRDKIPPLHLVLSHTHWDHILGLPFFAPLWSQGTQLRIYPLGNPDQERFQHNIFDDIHFPVAFDAIPSHVEFIRPVGPVWRVGSAHLHRIALNHPGGAQGFRVNDDDGTSVAYLTDNELSRPDTTSVDELARFAEGVDLLIHDSQYLPSDMPEKDGWGHSVVDDVLELGIKAAPKVLALYHHDPDRSDAQLDAIGEEAEQHLAGRDGTIRSVVAHEGLEIDLQNGSSSHKKGSAG